MGTAAIPAALVAEGTDVSLSLQDSFQVQDVAVGEVAVASDTAASLSVTSADTGPEASRTSESSLGDAQEVMLLHLSLIKRQRRMGIEKRTEVDADASDEASAGDGDDDTTDVDSKAATEDSAEETTPVTSESSADPAPLAVAVTEVNRTQAQQTVATADAQATDRTVEELGLPDLGAGKRRPSSNRLALTNIRQQVINAVRAEQSAMRTHAGMISLMARSRSERSASVR